MKPIDPAELIAAERARPEPSEELKAQARARLAALIGPDAGLGAPPSDAPLPVSDGGATAGAVGSGAWKLAAAFLAGGALGGGSVYALMDARVPETPHTVSTAAPTAVEAVPTTSATVAESATATPNPPASSAVSAAVPPTPRPPASASPPSNGADAQLAKERALIERARSALARGDSGEALRAVADHARAFPRGRLSEEREALAIQALAAAGRRSEAEQRAKSFERYYPNSVLRPAVERALGK